MEEKHIPARGSMSESRSTLRNADQGTVGKSWVEVLEKYLYGPECSFGGES